MPSRRRSVHALTAVLGLAALVAAPAGLAATAPPVTVPDVVADARSAQLAKQLPPDIDPVSHVLPEHMTWDDYRPVPGHDWTNPSSAPPKRIRAALVLADFEDQSFVVEDKGLTDDPADFYQRFLITEPSELNHFHTVDEYWQEDSFGLVGIDAEAFGPYRMPGKLHEFGLTSDMNAPGVDCPSGDTCNQDLDGAILEASAADTLAASATSGKEFAFRWLLHAGYDESGTWEEFGPMLFADKQDVTDDVDERTGQSLGNPDPAKTNHAKTRYQRPDGPWTSFFSAKQPWAHAVPGVYSTQGESDGQSTFAHELSHIFGVLDNYGNPFAGNADRDYSGPWDMLSRGTFNGPGGPHTRYRVPSDSGGTMGAHHMLRTKVRLGFIAPTDVATFPKQALQLGPQVVDVLQREQPMTANMRLNGLKYGISVLLGQDTGDTACPRPGNARCDGGGYNDYTVEVVNRVGYDSFTPDAGVLIAKTKKADLLPFLWVVDSHPDDIGATDYVKPDGTDQPYRFGDYRQLSDALFKAGRTGTNELGKGLAVAGETTNSYEDTGNGVKFLVLDKREDSAGVLTYRVAALSATPSPLLRYGVEASYVGGTDPEQLFTVTNTGSATDIVRVAVEAEGGAAKVLNDLVELAPGQTRTITVHTAHTRGLMFTATSEGDTSVGAVVGSTSVSSGPGPR